MADKVYVVDGRQFRTDNDYKMACHDHNIIEKLRSELKSGTDRKNADGTLQNAKRIKEELHSGKYHFYTLLGQDFEDELDEYIRSADTKAPKNKKTSNKKDISQKKISQKEISENKKASTAGSSKADTAFTKGDKANNRKAAKGGVPEVSEYMVEEELKNREKKRRLIILLCSVVALGCIGYLTVYSYYIKRTNATYEQWSSLKEQGASASGTNGTEKEVVINYDSTEKEIPDVLEEYKNLLNKNQKLIGWVKIDDTNIDYPVMQTSDNEYYLDHNLNQEYDKNGSIFMDKDCDVLKPSTNLILYGHHMKSGQMFGGLDKYQNKSYAEKHPYISFDTIYEHGTYQVMYVFRSKVYSEEDVNFKYYQFIDALSETEFDSNMQEMAEMSLYDTGVTAQYGDRLLTLSTCDYQEKNGRFVVVAKKID
jgi:sortase B